jgi:bifunctional ADP-heptose synthase (sugar kinase/adenylyltransferase)
VGRIVPVSFCGDDGEGYELRRELATLPGVELDHFVTTPERRTFTYCKPLVIMPDRPPVEINRFDSKNWTPTPPSVMTQLSVGLREVSGNVDALIVLEQVEEPETGVVTSELLHLIGELAVAKPDLPILADSRRGLTGWPMLSFKMNATELTAMFGCDLAVSVDEAKSRASVLARRHGRPVFVTLAARGIVAAAPDGSTEHVEALPVRGPIDVVGAGDAVTANLAAALSSGASLREAIELAVVASSVVIHQLGTTGTARVADLGAWADRISQA